METFEPSQRQSGAGVVPWSPPQVNWNPWTSCNIDEGPMAFVSLNVLWLWRFFSSEVQEVYMFFCLFIGRHIVMTS